MLSARGRLSSKGRPASNVKLGSRARHTQARVVEPFVMTMALLLMAKGAAAEPPPNKPRQTQPAPQARSAAAPAEPGAPKAEKRKPNASAEHSAGENDEPSAGTAPPDGSTADDSDEKASSAGHTGNAEEASDAAKPPERTRPQAVKVDAFPVGFATDKYGQPLVAVHLRGEPGTRYLVGPPHAQGDAFGNKGLPRLDMDELDTLCSSPCSRWLYPGSYSLALSRDDTVVRVPELLSISAPVEVIGDYESRTLWRAVGWGIMGAGLVGGTLFILSSLDNCNSTDGTCLQSQGNVFLGVGTILVGLTGGLLLTQMDDRATAQVRPARPEQGEPE